jgi:hypothetical protein
MTTTMPSARLQPGDAVWVDGARAYRLSVPGPPFACSTGGVWWLPAVVERARDDGWVIATLEARPSLRSWERRVAVPPEAVQAVATNAA